MDTKERREVTQGLKALIHKLNIEDRVYKATSALIHSGLEIDEMATEALQDLEGQARDARREAEQHPAARVV